MSVVPSPPPPPPPAAPPATMAKTGSPAAVTSVKTLHAMLATNRNRKVRDELISKKDIHCSFSQFSFNVNDSAYDKTFEETYSMGEVLGEGGFAVVYRCTHKENKHSYAVKEVLQDEYEAQGENIRDEIAALKLFKDNKYAVRLLDVFAEKDRTYLVMEECKGGDLLDMITEKVVYEEKQGRKLCRYLLEAIHSFHKKQIAHRDLKPENILLLHRDDELTVKIGDFGCAKLVTQGPTSLKTLVGSPEYCAPEVLAQEGYDHRCDLFSIGVVFFVILGGYSPWEASCPMEIPELISEANYYFNPEYWNTVSEQAKAVIASLLVVDVNERATAEKCLDSKWLRRRDSDLMRQGSVKNRFLHSLSDHCNDSLSHHASSHFNVELRPISEPRRGRIVMEREKSRAKTPPPPSRVAKKKKAGPSRLEAHLMKRETSPSNNLLDDDYEDHSCAEHSIDIVEEHPAFILSRSAQDAGGSEASLDIVTPHGGGSHGSKMLASVRELDDDDDDSTCGVFGRRTSKKHHSSTAANGTKKKSLFLHDDSSSDEDDSDSSDDNDDKPKKTPTLAKAPVPAAKKPTATAKAVAASTSKSAAKNKKKAASFLDDSSFDSSDDDDSSDDERRPSVPAAEKAYDSSSDDNDSSSKRRPTAVPESAEKEEISGMGMSSLAMTSDDDPPAKKDFLPVQSGHSVKSAEENLLELIRSTHSEMLERAEEVSENDDGSASSFGGDDAKESAENLLKIIGDSSALTSAPAEEADAAKSSADNLLQVISEANAEMLNAQEDDDPANEQLADITNDRASAAERDTTTDDNNLPTDTPSSDQAEKKTVGTAELDSSQTENNSPSSKETTTEKKTAEQQALPDAAPPPVQPKKAKPAKEQAVVYAAVQEAPRMLGFEEYWMLEASRRKYQF